MTSTSASPTGFERPPKDPNFAGILSLFLPGLGQIYNGQTRKGILFMFVAMINFLIFLQLIFTQPLVASLVSFGMAFHMKPNPELVMSLLQLRLGSAPSIILLGFFVAFIAYAIRDAYDHAAVLQRRQIYPEYVLEMPEATSGSYLVHFAVLLVCFILAFFFLIPPPPSRQITDIEFIQNQPPTQKKIIAPRRAQHASENAGKHENKEVVAPSPAPKSPSQAAPKATPQPVAKPVPHVTPTPTPHPTPAPTPTPRPTPTPHPTPTPQAHPTPQPAVRPNPTPSPTFKPSLSPSPRPAPMPTPFVHPGASPNPNPSPTPAPSLGHTGSPTPAPMPRIGAGAGPGNTSAPAPAPISVGSGQGGGNPSPVPVPVGGGSPNRGGGGGPAPAPAPSRAASHSGGGGGGSGPAILVAPSIPRAAGGGGGEGVRGNPDANNNPGKAPSVAAQQDVDFGPYMADLQRRIKRAWFPPKGNESKRVVVVFKIHKGGELSNLRLERSSGVAIADQAALKAVENAAPFRPLPSGASDDVDIQFTFDYNVFSGGSGVFRRF